MNKPLTSEIVARLPFSNSVQTESCVYIAGQAGIDTESGEIVGADIESQTRVTMENIRNILATHGLGLEHLVKVNVYLTDRELFSRFNETYREFFTTSFPARTTVYCDLNFDLLVEIDGIAVVNGISEKVNN